MVVQMILAVLLIAQVSYVISGGLILIALAMAGAYFPFALSLHYLFEFAFVAAALILIGPRLSAIDRRLYAAIEVDASGMQRLALPLVRVGFGLTLIWLALHNKLQSPALALAFLTEYPLKCMAAAGVNFFTDLHFALAAGIGEFVMGLLLVPGFSTRFWALGILGFLTSTIFTLGLL